VLKEAHNYIPTITNIPILARKKNMEEKTTMKTGNTNRKEIVTAYQSICIDIYKKNAADLKKIRFYIVSSQLR